MQQMYVALAGGAIFLVVVIYLLVGSRTSDATASERAHEEAQSRDPPVEIGETCEFAITEFTDHHSGQQVAVGKVEGFVVFASDVPEGASEGTVVRARVDSFNRGRTSADATVVGTS